MHDIKGAKQQCYGAECPYCTFDEKEAVSDFKYRDFLFDLAAKEFHAMHLKREQYGAPNNGPFTLIDRTAKNLNMSPIEVWFTWEDRHMSAINNMVELKHLHSRLKDLYGYVCAGIALVERELEL
jgi:hypothetical protein